MVSWGRSGAFKVVLTVVAGIGGVIYLVVRYRTQAMNEADDKRKDASAYREAEQYIEDKLFRGIEMLGAEPVSTKIAGVYALTDVSDTYGGRYKQRVAEILCGYLRSKRTEAESVVEETIVDEIKSRVSKPVTWKISAHRLYDWSDLNFNLSGAEFFGPVMFYEMRINGVLSMAQCVFHQYLAIENSYVHQFFGYACSFQSDVDIHNIAGEKFEISGASPASESHFSITNVQNFGVGILKLEDNRKVKVDGYHVDYNRDPQDDDGYAYLLRKNKKSQ